ncbi:MAG: adenosylhomocysteinase [Aminobacterium sp.]|uniref:adenosylhomocysteinase n=1 Tax=unclassified Aminobacterium TaxID=2685012 RepID=UPI001BD072FA|nr:MULTISPECIES: adenosylhomocysteinase [unclassified Aminobacterium]MDD2205850.1 adenosylhomocysteinase [Aminobacterium sp.]MDD3425699.1 adenosylhomocysteinase [Aminobacterium sp.]MDD3706701.1 adenosylhomocysteinase [Aminobacterium sp.]MDD4228135.1 adenosylhomocysteinase [Aminobacterium sp.]MDD4550880.1 adenosylhomocysteinase [Aminobacterium sp.]
MENRIADIHLSSEGMKKITWAWQFMPVLRSLSEEYTSKAPLKGLKLAACLHLEAKTACLLITLHKLGAEVWAAGSNPLSTQDDICAALVDNGVHVYSHHGMTTEEYHENLRFVLSIAPDVIVDDGADLIATLHTEFPQLIPNVRGGSEETTTGIKRLKAMEADGTLQFPMIAVNDAYSKYLFDNRYGTGQSVMDGLMRTTNMLIAGKKVVVVGYGWCGRGVAMRAKSLGASVIVVEVDPHRAFEALMDGHEVMNMTEAASVGDIFLTLTGNTKVIRKEHFEKMKSGVLLANAGHFDVEICKKDLSQMASSVESTRENIETYTLTDGRRLHLLGEGRLVNLACADGHPIEIMDLSFALQLESALHVAHNKLQSGVHPVPSAIDRRVMEVKLESLGISLEKLTDEQELYMKSWEE